MPDILGTVEKIVRVGLAIKKAVETVRQNEVECQEIQELVATLMDILPLLQETAVMKHPAMHRALVGLERTLNRALKLIADCQAKRNIACRVLGSEDMSRKLRKVRDDILLRTVLGTFATTVHVSMTLTNTIPYAGGAHPPLLTQPQDTGELKVSCRNRLTTDDSRSRVNRNIIMAAKGRTVRRHYHQWETMIMVQMTYEKRQYKVMMKLVFEMGDCVMDNVRLTYCEDKDQMGVVPLGATACTAPSRPPIFTRNSRMLMIGNEYTADWLVEQEPVPIMRACGIVFVFLFLIFLRILVPSRLGVFGV
ncbi:hypothetical protein BS78_05G234500 [Paspalum vaginatum]|nr:hypothetical protein BS78_05G234500 [Paspalum vaginatum]